MKKAEKDEKLKKAKKLNFSNGWLCEEMKKLKKDDFCYTN